VKRTAQPDADVEDELATLLVRAAAEREERWRSLLGNVLVTMTLLLVGLGPHLPGASFVLGHITAGESARVAGVSWCLFELATVTFHLLGPGHALSVLLSVFDGLGRRAAFVVLVYLSDATSLPLWLIGMVSSFALTAKPPRRRALDLVLIVASHIALVFAFLVERHVAGAWLTVLVLLASTSAQTMSARTAARTARVRAERNVLERRLRDATLRGDREKMARELHDGIGADVMALVLRLQRAARKGDNPKAGALANKARDLLDELRAVVWSLRNQQGTLAELGKLIDATCRGIRGEIAYERVTPLAVAEARIGPSAALAALTCARELVRIAATRGGVTKLRLSLTVASVLELTVEDDGASLAPEALAGTLGSLDGARRSLDAASEGIDVSNLPDDGGVRMYAKIALEQRRPVAGDATMYAGWGDAPSR
jgi:signal transduction histidine kinase